tara:strand:+ start:7859 stop:11452 length:3594 start_codon:yes stop_codon:yes gene_type:complete
MGNNTDVVILDSLQAIIVNQSLEETAKIKAIKKLLSNAPSKEAHDKYLTIKDNNWHKTPIQCAAEQGLWKIFSYLKKKGANYENDCNGRNLAHHAAFYLNFKLINELLVADPLLAEQSDNDKLIPIQYAFTNGKVKSITYFQSMAQCLFPKYPSNKTNPLHIAVSDNDEQRAASLLVTLPRLINLYNENKQTPLHLAIQLCHFKVAYLLASNSAIDRWATDASHRTAYDLLLEAKRNFKDQNIEVISDLIKRLQPQPFSSVFRESSESTNHQKPTTSSRELSNSFENISAEENKLFSRTYTINDPALSSPSLWEETFEPYADLSIDSLSSSFSFLSSKSKIYEPDCSGEETFRDAAKDIEFTTTPRTPKSPRQRGNTRNNLMLGKSHPTATHKENNPIAIASSDSIVLEGINVQTPANKVKLKEFPTTPLAAFTSGYAKLFKQYIDSGQKLEFDFEDTEQFIQYFSNSPIFGKIDPWRPLQQIEGELRILALKAYNHFAENQQNIESKIIQSLQKHGIGKETELSTLSNLSLTKNNQLYNVLYLLCRNLSFNSHQYTLIALGLLEEYDAIDLLNQLAHLIPLQSKSERLINIYMIKELIIWDDKQHIIKNSIFEQTLNESTGLSQYLVKYEVHDLLNELIKSKSELKSSPFEFYRLFSDAFQGVLTENLLSIDLIFSIALGVVSTKSTEQSSQEAYALLRSELQKVSLTTFRNASADEFRQRYTSKTELTSKYSPHIKYNQDMTNGLVYYLINKILDCKTNAERCNMICLLILLANDLLNINNSPHDNQNLGPDLTTGSAIMAALSHHTIDRLKDTWKLVMGRKFFEEAYISLQKTFSSDGNYAVLRALQNTTVAPIPFICIFLRDIIYFKDRKFSNNNLKQNDIAKYYKDLGTVFFYLRTLRRQLACVNNIPRTKLSSQLQILSEIEPSILEIKTQRIMPRVLKLTSTSTPDLIKFIMLHCQAENPLELITAEDKKITGVEALNKLYHWTRKLVDEEKIDNKQAQDFMFFLCDFVSFSNKISINKSMYLKDFNDRIVVKKINSDSKPVHTPRQTQDCESDMTEKLMGLLTQKQSQRKVDCLTYLKETSNQENENNQLNQASHKDRSRTSYSIPLSINEQKNSLLSSAVIEPSWQKKNKGSIGRQFIISNYRESSVLSTMTTTNPISAPFDFKNKESLKQDTLEPIRYPPKSKNNIT